MQVRITFDTDNHAFHREGPAEAARILRGVAQSLTVGATGGPIHDTNGNRVGRWDASFPAQED